MYAYPSPPEFRPEVYPNLKEASKPAYMGLTVFLREEPWLVIGFDGKKHILENEKGEVLMTDSSLDWRSASSKSALIAASRSVESPIPEGRIVYEDGQWDLRVGDSSIPVEEIVEELEKANWDKNALDIDKSKDNDERVESLACPNCNSHTVKLVDREAHQFHCFSCKKNFNHEVWFNPKSHVAYEVDKGNNWHPYAPGPDDPKKVPHCHNCGYSWKEHHHFQIGDACPQCGHPVKPHAQEDVMALEGQGWKKHHGRLNVDKEGNELVVGKPYVMHSPKWKVPDVVYITKSEPTLVEANIDGDETSYWPVKIDENEYSKWEYFFEPFYSWDYNRTTDSMGGRDTGMPIQENPLDYDENVHNQNELASPPNASPMGMPRHDDFLDLHTPRGSVHTMTNHLNGSALLVMADGKGGIMGWAPMDPELSPEFVKWDTHDLHKVEEAIHSGLYREDMPQNIPIGDDDEEIDANPLVEPVPQKLPLPMPSPEPVTQPTRIPELVPTGKIARQVFTPSQQKELIDEGINRQARNFHKLNLAGTHYEKREIEEDNFLWLW